MTQPPGVGASLAQKLDFLFAVVRPPGGQRPYTARDVVTAMTAAGYPISPAHMSDLRNGAAKNPTMQVLSGLAHVFDVRAAYFLDDPQVVEEVEARLELQSAQRDAEVADIALRVAGLHPGQQAALHRELARIIREHDDSPAARDRSHE